MPLTHERLQRIRARWQMRRDRHPEAHRDIETLAAHIQSGAPLVRDSTPPVVSLGQGAFTQDYHDEDLLQGSGDD